MHMDKLLLHKFVDRRIQQGLDFRWSAFQGMHNKGNSYSQRNAAIAESPRGISLPVYQSIKYWVEQKTVKKEGKVESEQERTELTRVSCCV